MVWECRDDLMLEEMEFLGNEIEVAKLKSTSKKMKSCGRDKN